MALVGLFESNINNSRWISGSSLTNMAHKRKMYSTIHRTLERLKNKVENILFVIEMADSTKCKILKALLTAEEGKSYSGVGLLL